MTRRSFVCGACALATSLAGCGSATRPDEAAVEPVVLAISDVPVGGGTVFREQRLVVTQPTAGAFMAFSAVCPHQGCTVNAVVDGTINCPCHGSQFDSADGTLVRGPAQTGLTARGVTVDGDVLRIG